MPKNVQTTIQLYLFHILASLCLKSFKLGFSSMWTENFQMYQLGLEKAQEPEIKLPTFVRSWRKQRKSRKASTFASLTTWKPLCGWQQTVGNSYWIILLVSWETCIQSQEATVKTGHGTIDWFKIGKGLQSSPCLFNFYAKYITQNARLDKLPAGIKTVGRNIDRWYHSSGRKWRGTKETLHDGTEEWWSSQYLGYILEKCWLQQLFNPVTWQ